MILRRFGSSVGAVEPDFKAEAFTEISFVRRPGFTLPWSEFAERYERVGEVVLAAESEGRVKLEAEIELLRLLGAQLAQAAAHLEPGEVLLVESQPGHDYPRTHEHTDSVIEDGNIRLHFRYTMDPPLRLGRYRERQG